MIADKVFARLDGEDVSKKVIQEYVDVVEDRLCVRLGVDTLPLRFESICADAVVKMHRRYYYEGISSENDGGISTSFVDDILAEYNSEISAWKSKGNGVRFI